MLPPHLCVAMSPPTVIQGVWLNRFEHSVFLPDASLAKLGRYRGPEVAIYARSDDGRPAPVWFATKGRLAGIRFVGRRNLYSGRFGTFGLHTQVIVIDRVMAVHVLDQPVSDRWIEHPS